MHPLKIILTEAGKKLLLGEPVRFGRKRPCRHKVPNTRRGPTPTTSDCDAYWIDFALDEEGDRGLAEEEARIRKLLATYRIKPAAAIDRFLADSRRDELIAWFESKRRVLKNPGGFAYRLVHHTDAMWKEHQKQARQNEEQAEFQGGR